MAPFIGIDGSAVCHFLLVVQVLVVRLVSFPDYPRRTRNEKMTAASAGDNGYGRRCIRSVLCERTELTGDAGQQRAVGTNEIETVQADMDD